MSLLRCSGNMSVCLSVRVDRLGPMGQPAHSVILLFFKFGHLITVFSCLGWLLFQELPLLIQIQIQKALFVPVGQFSFYSSPGHTHFHTAHSSMAERTR